MTRKILVAVLLAAISQARSVQAQATAVASTPASRIASVMTSEDFARCGLTKLSAAELAAFDEWLQAYTSAVVAYVVAQPPTSSESAAPRSSAKTYKVEATANDEAFVINGELFKAKTYCFGVNQGDEVLFTGGSPNGACVSAEFVVLRTGKTCKVWCE